MNNQPKCYLSEVKMPALGAPIKGKVRDNWVIRKDDSQYRLILTTDRQSFNNQKILIPGKGRISNMVSAFWFALTRDIIPNHLISTPHPNLSFVRQAKEVVPIEVIVRRYLTKRCSPTSIYVNYFERGRRKIYGINFPEKLRPNEEFPMGTIITPTTKSNYGPDQELSDEEAEKIVDGKFGSGTWASIRVKALKVFERAYSHCATRGLILADTKFEFGIDENDQIMLIDELLAPEGSTYWLTDQYDEKIRRSENPYPDKDDLLTRLLNQPTERLILNEIIQNQEMLFKKITGKKLPRLENDPDKIKKIALVFLQQKNLI